VINDADQFHGDIRIDAGFVNLTPSSTVSPSLGVTVNAAGELGVEGDHAIGALDGAGSVELMTPAITLTIGSDDSTGAYAGDLIAPAGAMIAKVGAGEEVLSGDGGAFFGEFVVNGGLLSGGDPALTSASGVSIGPSGTFAANGNAAVALVTGSGTLQLGPQTNVGGTGDSWAFDGQIIGTLSGSLRKQGAGTVTLTGDTSGALGFFDVLGGEARFTGNEIFPNAQAVFVNGSSTLAGHGAFASLLTVTGTIRADVAGEPIVLLGQDKDNLGHIESVSGGIIEVRGCTLTQLLNGNFEDAVLRADNAIIRLTGPGTPVIDGGIVETVGEGHVEVDGVRATLRDTDLEGNIVLLGGGGLDLDATDLRTGPTDTITVGLGTGGNATSLIDGTGTVDLAGTLAIELANGYAPAAGDGFVFYNDAASPGLSITGGFAGVTLPDISPLLFRVIDEPGLLEIAVSCAADFSPPFGVFDLADINAFVAGFLALDSLVDLNSDGVYDLTDINLFVQAFVDGCP